MRLRHALLSAAASLALATSAHADIRLRLHLSPVTGSPLLPAVQTANIGQQTTAEAGCIPTNYTGAGTLVVSGSDAAQYKIDTAGGQSCLVPTFTTPYTAGHAPETQPFLTAGWSVGRVSNLLLSDGTVSGSMAVTLVPGFTISQDNRDDTIACSGLPNTICQINAAWDTAKKLTSSLNEPINMRAGTYNASQLGWTMLVGANPANALNSNWSTSCTYDVNCPWVTLQPETPGTVTVTTLGVKGIGTSGGLAPGVATYALLHMKGIKINFSAAGNTTKDVSGTFGIDVYNNVRAIWLDGLDIQSNTSRVDCNLTVTPSCVDGSKFGNVFSGLHVAVNVNRDTVDTASNSQIYITDNHVHDVYTGINVAGGNGVTLLRNDVEYFWEDAFHLSSTDGLLGEWNFMHNRMDGVSHGDYVQMPWSFIGSGTYGPVVWDYNVAALGRGGGSGDKSLGYGVQADDGNNFVWSCAPCSNAFIITNAEFVGNVVIGAMGNGAGPNAYTGITVRNNIFIRDQSGQIQGSNATNPRFLFYGPAYGAEGGNFQCNVMMDASPFYGLSSGSPDPPNVTRTVNGVESNIQLLASGYAAAFQGTLPTSQPSTGPTLAQIQAIIAPKSGGVLDTVNTTGGCKPGPSAYIDYVNHTVTGLPSYAP